MHSRSSVANVFSLTPCQCKQDFGQLKKGHTQLKMHKLDTAEFFTLQTDT